MPGVGVDALFPTVANHNSAASVRKLVVLVAPTQCEQSIV